MSDQPDLFPIEESVHPHRQAFDAWKVERNIETYPPGWDGDNPDVWHALHRDFQEWGEGETEEEACTALQSDLATFLPHWLEPIAKEGA